VKKGTNLRERCNTIIEAKGGKIAEKARNILLKESIEGFGDPLKYVSMNWRDLLTPALVILSNEAVTTEGSLCKAVEETALAMTVLNLGVNLWDDIIDTTKHKGLVPTALAKYGEGITLMIGGLATAKSFLILNRMKVAREINSALSTEIWNYCKKLAEAEIANINLRKGSCIYPEEKLHVIEMQAVNLETVCRVGAILGEASKKEIKILGRYGHCLSMILELIKDVKVTLNFTLELPEKIISNAMPFTLSFAKFHSGDVENLLQSSLCGSKLQDVETLVKTVLETNALENTLSIIQNLAETARAEISRLQPSASRDSLDFFVGAQHAILLWLLQAGSS
jgi:geranylgeranyl pyrophosphate synthase